MKEPYAERMDSIRDRYVRKGGGLVYHYTDASAVCAILRTGCVWASNTLTLNDTTEVRHYKTIISANATSYLSGVAEPLRSALVDTALRTYEKLLSSFEPNIYVLSFSALPDSVGLWARYANYDGYSLGFDARELEIESDSHKPRLYNAAGELLTDTHTSSFSGNVVYDRSLQVSVAGDYMHVLLDADRAKANGELSMEQHRDLWVSIFQDLVFFSLFAKHESYSEEQEYRFALILSPDPDHRKDLAFFRARNGLILPYLKFDLRTASGVLPLREIVTGPTAYGDRSIATLQYLLDAQGLKEVKVRRSGVPLRP